MNFFVLRSTFRNFAVKIMSKDMKKLLLMGIIAVLTGCSLTHTDDDAATDAAEQWAWAFFNCDFHEASQYCTPESNQWLRFAASNITEEDLKRLQEKELEVTPTDYFPEANDTMRVVELKVKNFLKPTAVGTPSTIQEEGCFHVCVVNRDGKWLVRMAGLPRSEKQSLD
jgi:hypothetical protein